MGVGCRKKTANLEICKRNKQKKKIKIKIVLNKKGFQSAFKNGAKAASGEYISFLGDDDKLVKNIFIILTKKIKLSNPNWIIGYGCYIDNKKKK